MKRPTSLTLRLTLLFSAVATVVLLSFGWLIERSIEEHFILQDIKELKIVAQAVERSLSTLQSSHDSTSKNRELERAKQRFSDMLVGHHSTLLLITDATEQRLYFNTGPDLSLIQRPTRGLQQGVVQQWNNGKHNYRVFIQQIIGKNNLLYTVTVAVAIDFHLHFLTTFRHTLWLMVACGIIVMGVMGWVAVRQGHRPLHRIVEQISQTSANEFNTLLDPSIVPAELTELALSYNELLQRMEEAFNRLSNFSADIAHELRTPVTNLMTQTQVALSQARDTNEYQEILYSNMEEYERMAQMIGDMLFLAKADNTRHPPNTEEIELQSEVHNLFDYYGAWAEECHVSLALSGDAHVQADRLMLRRALSNLLSNAIRYTPKKNRVDVILSQTEDEVIIIVQNPGTPIPAEHLEKIFDRFYRTDPSRQRSGEGAGLGLAIVKSIVEAHSGTIVATSDETGTQFSINLPRIVDA
ncbi:Copper sensory histidine kinase CusS [hydrothermal vent metagenome]|uniref:histidine kinase n=1 Tax=hydrothermal vent metagenome TaxID=652676 RepID=A0A3B0ZXY5_9ZZZZ